MGNTALKSAKIFTAAAVLIAMCLALPPSSARAASIGTGADITAANAVYFGAYEQDNNSGNGKEPVEWRVLEKTSTQLFLLSEKNLDAKPYNDTYTSVTWETSTIRAWLNNYTAGTPTNGTVSNPYSDGGFIAAFNAREKNAIPATQVHTYIYNSDTTEQTGSPTSDQIFLLSVPEVTSAALGFPASTAPDSSRVALNTTYAISKGAGSHWWLRSPGSNGGREAGVDGGGYVDNDIVN